MKRTFFLAFSALLLIGLACANTPSATPQPPGQVETMVAQTLAALTLAAPTETPIPPTPAPVCQPPHPGPAINATWPAGFAVSNSQTGALSIYDIRGNLLASHTLADIPPSPQVHIGSLASGPSISYFTFASGGQLRVYRQSTTTPLLNTGDLVWLAGANGTDTLVYVLVTTNASSSGWASTVHTANAQTLTLAPAPALSRDMNDGYIYKPLAVQAASGQATGLWHTLSMWGIGNINWAPYSGLYYTDLASGQTTTYLGPDDRLIALSPDQTWAAFAPNGSRNRPGDALIIRDLARTCQDIRIPWESDSNQGGGQAAISPDNGMIAWVEASGPDAMSAVFRLRVARLENGAYTDLINAPVSQLTTLGGGVAPNYVGPLAWVDDHVLLVSMYLPGNNTPQLALWAPDPARPLDPSLGTHQSILIAGGDFAGLVYP